ncbi:MAG: GvpL/GvpF family gas vesicle protein [Ignavibacteriales bacterium]|nr:GvpL/GvpF family gas vesicle protein [Ignavibacteriales bacterium]
MNASGLYIYGIINSDSGKILANFSTTDGDKVYCIPYQEISAVVCRSKVINYSYMPKDALVRLLLKHQLLIEEIMNLGSPIIPMKLGTFVSDEKEANNFLSKGYALSKEILKKINDKIEIDVVVTWNDLTSVLKEISEDNVIKDIKQSMLAEQKGITVENQIRIGTLIKNELDQIRGIISSNIFTSLKDCCDDIKTHAPMDDKMIANFASLIKKEKRKEFEEKVDKLNSTFSGKLNFKCVGPLPPYSFYTLEMKKLLQKDLEWALNLLELKNSTITKDEIKKAYRRLSFSSHPDKNPKAGNSEKEFDQLNKAYKVLYEFCHSQEQIESGKSKFCYLNNFEDSAIVVRVRNQHD